MRYCLIQAFMMARLIFTIGSSSFVIQSEYAMSAMQFSLLFGLNGIRADYRGADLSCPHGRLPAPKSCLRGGQLLAVTFAAIITCSSPGYCCRRWRWSAVFTVL